MIAVSDNLVLAVQSIRAHKLRAALTLLGLVMGVATLITVMTLVQGANKYVETKIANLGTNVFRVARTPFAATDFTVVTKALRNKRLTLEDLQAVFEQCKACELVGGSANTSVSVVFKNHQIDDSNLIGYSANMADIDTRKVVLGRYFSPSEEQHNAEVCLIGQKLVDEFFPDTDPQGKTVRAGNQEFTVVGVFEKLGSVLGQDQDNFLVIPLTTYLRTRGPRTSITMEIKASGPAQVFDRAQDEVKVIMRSRRHVQAGADEDFFIGTSESYMALWRSISGAFFVVFVMVSSISAVVGGIVIMNVMLVSVTERTKEIGIRRAVGATQTDILRQFLAESIVQCIFGGAIGIGIGFLCALALRTFTSFPASVQTWVAILGVILSSSIGIFFGIYPAKKASELDPVTALRAD